MTGRSTLTGAYRDRTVAIFLKRKRTRHSVSYLVV